MSSYLKIINSETGSIKEEKISQEVGAFIEDSLTEMSVLMSEIDYCFMFRQNATELMDEILSGSRSHDSVFNELNRKFMNLLNSFYAWIEYHESNYKVVFSSLKTHYYDKYFEYRLAYSLRKYTTHCAVSITRISYDVLKETESIQIDPRELLKNKEYLNRYITKDLQEIVNKGEYIDLKLFLIKLLSIFESFQSELWKQLIPDIGEKVDRILSITQLFHNEEIYDVILETKKGESHKIGVITYQLIKKINTIKLGENLASFLELN